MSFKLNSLFLTDGYKVNHVRMLAPGTTKLYGTWIPRSVKHAPKGITKIVSFGQQLVWKWLHDEFEENFFFNDIRKKSDDYEMAGGTQSMFIADKKELKKEALQFVKDMNLYLGMEYDSKHFEELWDLGYLPIKVKALPEGIETLPNIPHMTFVNTVDGFAWLTLYLETVVSSLAWKPSTAATIAKLYRRQAEEWVAKTDEKNMWLVDYMCHDFSARGLDPMSQYLIGLGHATSFKGSDTLPVIPASKYFYGVKEDEMPINSVNASEHSVSTTKIFTVGEQQMIADWLQIFPKGILSIVSDTFDLWKLITEYLPANKEAIMARDGKLVIRPDSGDPVDIICGTYNKFTQGAHNETPQEAGVIELLWDIFGGTVNAQGYKVLDPHIGAIYGDSITTERQVQIYERLAAKGFAATNIVLGVGSFTYQYNTRDTLGFAAKGAWFEVEEEFLATPESVEWGVRTKSYNIYKDPITDDGSKKSLKGLCAVHKVNSRDNFDKFMTKDTQFPIKEYIVKTECTPEEENQGLLQVIYEDGKFFNQVTLEKVRNRLKQI
jgi:nicotinamide phosphoribosyltransferase